MFSVIQVRYRTVKRSIKVSLLTVDISKMLSRLEGEKEGLD